MKDLGAVFKLTHARAAEEERMIDCLFQFKIKQGLVPSIKIERPACKRWGIPLARPEEIARGYRHSELEKDPDLKSKLLNKVLPISANVFKSWEAPLETKPSLQHPSLAGIQFLRWTYLTPDLEEHLSTYELWKRYRLGQLDPQASLQPLGETIENLIAGKTVFGQSLAAPTPPLEDSIKWIYQRKAKQETLSFQQLRGRYQRGLLDPNASVQPVGQTIENLIAADSLFGQLLTQPSPSLEEPLLTPFFQNERILQAYERCEKTKWSYHRQETSFQSSFKEFLALFIQGIPLSRIQPCTPCVSNEDIILALTQTTWKAVLPDLYLYQTQNRRTPEEHLLLHPSPSLQVKPFAKNMRTMQELINQPKLLESILERLNEQAQYKAFLTGLFQFLDLHAKNIGLSPCPDPYVEKFSNQEFKVFSLLDFQTIQDNLIIHSKSFDDLHKEYLTKIINLNTWISYQDEQGSTILNQLKQLPDLLQALECKWQWVFFDLDLCLGESNSFHKIKKGFQYTTLFPLRSSFLRLEYKDEPLNAYTLSQIENSDETDAQMEKWIKRLDAPIRKRLSKETQTQIDLILDILLQRPQYSLSHAREEDGIGILKTIQEKFSHDLALIKEPLHKMIWERIEQDLSYAIVLNHDTYETLARRHKQDPLYLRNLNSGLPLIPGCKVKISYSLFGLDPNSYGKRARIAKQLFPRLSWKQQKALKERQTACKNYISSYRHLQQLTGDPETILELLERFINSSLFTASEQKNLKCYMQENAQQLLQNPSKLKDFKSHIEKHRRPTLFRLMQVMYPHLKDVYSLCEAWSAYYKGRQPGQLIGDYSYPLEKIMSDVQACYPQNSDAYQTSLAVSQAIKNEKDPSLFFNFN